MRAALLSRPLPELSRDPGLSRRFPSAVARRGPRSRSPGVQGKRWEFIPLSPEEAARSPHHPVPSAGQPRGRCAGVKGVGPPWHPQVVAVGSGPGDPAGSFSGPSRLPPAPWEFLSPGSPLRRRGTSSSVAMMDPLENNLFDLPDYENTEDETFPPLPPPASPGRDDVEWAQANGEPDGNQQSQTKDSAVATRRAVKRPMPKLDAQRLISERGLPALRHMFDNVKFKGKGHEAEDLKTLIRHMEHWAHRLFPKLQFEDFVDRVESLGSKKEVQTCLKRIRLDLPILHEDFASNEDGGGESNGLDTATEDAHSCSGNVEEFTSLPGTTLTEEQQQRMQKNRQLALERRQAKMQCGSQPQHTEFPISSSEEEFTTPVAQDPSDLIEDTQVNTTKVAVTEAEAGDRELECASEKQ